MSCTEFQPDFYNNIAAVGVVLLFAKVVTRRASQAKHGDWLAVVHAAAVVAAGMAAAVAIWATEHCTQTQVWHTLSWIGVIVAATALLVDVLVDERDARSRRRGSPDTQPRDPVTTPVSRN